MREYFNFKKAIFENLSNDFDSVNFFFKVILERFLQNMFEFFSVLS